VISRIVRENLLSIIAAYRKATGKSLTAVSKQFYGNSTFFRTLKSGDHSITVARLDTMLEDIRAKWPEDARWPLTRAIHMGRKPQE
jgi:hypothetical protein